MTTFIDMKFGLLLFLLFILSIISSITTDGFFESPFNKDGTWRKMRQKVTNSKYKQNIFSYLFRHISVANILLKSMGQVTSILSCTSLR